jgi:hypothetical protein
MAVPPWTHANPYTGTAVIVVITAVARIVRITAIVVVWPWHANTYTDAAGSRIKADLRHRRYGGQYARGRDNAERDLFHEYSPLIRYIENARGKVLFQDYSGTSDSR